jgi:hypothetical protein
MPPLPPKSCRASRRVSEQAWHRRTGGRRRCSTGIPSLQRSSGSADRPNAADRHLADGRVPGIGGFRQATGWGIDTIEEPTSEVTRFRWG